MNSDEEACAVTRGLIDIELDLCYSPEEVNLPFAADSDEDLSVQRLGRSEFERCRAKSDKLHAEAVRTIAGHPELGLAVRLPAATTGCAARGTLSGMATGSEPSALG